jgi:cell division inhibitor SepF
MATAMRKIGVYLGLVEDDPMSTHYDDYAYRNGDPAVRSVSDPTPARSQEPSVATVSDVRSGATVATMPDAAALATAELTSIHTIHPRSYNDARRVGEEFRSGHPVILNLTEMADADAKRIVDFAAGLIFGLHGTIERVTNKVFLLSPRNVDVRDSPAVRQARDGFFNQS